MHVYNMCMRKVLLCIYDSGASGKRGNRYAFNNSFFLFNQLNTNIYTSTAYIKITYEQSELVMLWITAEFGKIFENLNNNRNNKKSKGNVIRELNTTVNIFHSLKRKQKKKMQEKNCILFANQFF